MTKPIVLITGAGIGIGRATAFAFAGAGYHVVLSNSREPGTLSDLARRLGPRAQAATPAEAAAAGDIVVVAVPLNAYKQIPVAPSARAE